MQRTATDFNVADKLSAAKLQELNADLDRLFARLSNEDLGFTYNGLGFLTQIIDNENSITINLDRSDRNDPIPRIYIQEVGDPKKYTITYAALLGPLQSVVYA